jgi:hypothetical protein
MLVGLNSAIDLRLLGFAPGIPLKSLENTFRFMWAGFVLNAATGGLLFISDATKHSSNPAFYVKLAGVALAVVILILIRSKVFREQKNGKILAAASLACWFVAMSAGRLMAYIIEFIL